MKTSEMFLQILNELKYIRESKGIPPMPKNLPEDHHAVYVTYEDLSKHSDFRSKCTSVAQIYVNNEWEMNWQVMQDSTTPQDRAFYLKRFDHEIEADQVVAWAKERGYRPATHIEACAFINERPQFRTGEIIVALGDHTTQMNKRFVCTLAGGIALNCAEYVTLFNLNYTFLLIKKQ